MNKRMSTSSWPRDDERVRQRAEYIHIYSLYQFISIAFLAEFKSKFINLFQEPK